jgi:hypothetical protein
MVVTVQAVERGHTSKLHSSPGPADQFTFM